MNKKNKKSFDLIKEIIEQPKLEKVLNSTEQEQLETEIYRIAIDNELQEKILADKNKWIVELLNEIEELRKINKNCISKDKIRDKLKELRKTENKMYKSDIEFEPETAIDSLLLRIADLNELLEEN